MGGGAAMRVAAKAAGLGLQNTGVRGGLPENFAARKAIRASASVLSSTTSVEDAGKIEVTAVSQTAPALEFAGYYVEEKPRLVFCPAPSLEETNDAASELRDALDTMYFSPSKSAGNFNSLSASNDHSTVLKSESSHADTKTCVPSQSSSVPNQALQAFKLLRENPAAKSVVASIAADPDVWNAVLQNEALKEFLELREKMHGV